MYYRLSVFPIVIPPLRDRPSDIRVFAEYFAERAANRFGLRAVPISNDDVRVLAEYRWPGNVREMAAVMDRAVLHRTGPRAQRGGGTRPGHADRERCTGQCRRTPRRQSPSSRSTSCIRRHIEAALRQTHGRVEGPHGAARMLRINPHTLRARMRKLKINWRAFRAIRDGAA